MKPTPWPVLLALTAALAAGCGRPPDSVTGGPSREHPVKLRFQTDWYPQAEHGGFYQALAKGYYREAGLDVEIIGGKPGFTAPQSVLSGLSDLAMMRSDDLIAMVARGLPLVIVGAYMEHDPQGVLVHADSTVKTFADINGHTLMAGPGQAWVEFIRRHYHIEFRMIPVAYGVAQFMADPDLVQQCFVTNEPYYVKLKGGTSRVLPLADSGYDPYRVIFTTTGFVREHPAALRAFVTTSHRGWVDFMNGDPTPAMKLIIQRNQLMSEPFVRFSLAAMKQFHLVDGDPARGERSGLMTRERLAEQSQALADLKLIPAPLAVDRFAVNVDP